MTWILFAIISYFLNAVTAITDKFLLKKSIPSVAAYSFYVGLLSVFAVILIPFGVVWPGWQTVLLDLIPGAVFFWTVYFFVVAVKKYEVSRVVTMVGGFAPIFTLLLSSLFLGERLGAMQLWAFVFLVAGGVLISFKEDKSGQNKRNLFLGIEISLVSAFVFALYYVSAKFIFSDGQPFISAFFWSRMGSFLMAVLILAIPAWRNSILGARKAAGAKGGSLFIFNKVLAALAFILLNKAIELGDAALVNAIQGVQFVFLFGLAIVLSRKYPKVLEEHLTPAIIMQKIMAIVLISFGLALLYF